MSEKVTRKQQAILEYIESYIEDFGMSPTYREIMEGLNYKSVATVAKHINNLVLLGLLDKDDNSARSLCLRRSKYNSKDMILCRKILELKRNDMMNDRKDYEAKLIQDVINIVFDSEINK